MRDYCQHGEPMDEHCPQCAGHTKAAANDSATAPVPAGGTPEGLAREKVEMTDSEVKSSSPTTEAGRELLSELWPDGEPSGKGGRGWHLIQWGYARLLLDGEDGGESPPTCPRCGYAIEREGQLCLATRQRTECRVGDASESGHPPEEHAPGCDGNCGNLPGSMQCFA